jgi:hypothetical protein
MDSKDLQKVAAKHGISKDVWRLSMGYQNAQQDPTEPVPIAGKRIRQSKGLRGSKLERIYLRYLQRLWPGANFHHGDVRLRIANGCYYTPDIHAMVPWPIMIHPVFWEVKGPYAYEDSLIKLKVVATQYPDYVFVLVWRDKVGMWRNQEILSLNRG